MHPKSKHYHNFEQYFQMSESKPHLMSSQSISAWMHPFRLLLIEWSISRKKHYSYFTWSPLEFQEFGLNFSCFQSSSSRLTVFQLSIGSLSVLLFSITWIHYLLMLSFLVSYSTSKCLRLNKFQPIILQVNIKLLLFTSNHSITSSGIHKEVCVC